MIRYSGECMKCKHEWISRYGNQPNICPKCKSPMIATKAIMSGDKPKKNGSKQ